LLYEDQYTIAGAKKRLANDLRAGGKLKIVSSEGSDGEFTGETESQGSTPVDQADAGARSAADRKAIQGISKELRDILALLDSPANNSKPR
jgi:hypothetical protein